MTTKTAEKPGRVGAKPAAPAATPALAQADPAPQDSPGNAAGDLAAIRTQILPLRDRLATVDADLAAIDAEPLPDTGYDIEELIVGRQRVNVRKVELQSARDVLLDKLCPLEAREAELAEQAAAEARAEARRQSVALGEEALAKVKAARAALNAAIVTFKADIAQTPVNAKLVPEIHFAVKAEGDHLLATYRALLTAAG